MRKEKRSQRKARAVADMELEIHFHAQDAVSVLIQSAIPAGEEEQGAELALVALVAARQVANLANHPSNAGLTGILSAVPAEALADLADHNSPDGPRLVGYQGAAGRVRFAASLSMEPFKFRFDSKGMGFFAKGVGYYAPQSVMALLRHLAGRHRNDPGFLASLAATARTVGEAGRAGRITVTSQAHVAMTAFQAGLLEGVVARDVMTPEPAAAETRTDPSMFRRGKKTQDIALPKAVSLLVERIAELEGPYHHVRPELECHEALAVAVSTIFEGADAKEIFAFFANEESGKLSHDDDPAPRGAARASRGLGAPARLILPGPDPSPGRPLSLGQSVDLAVRAPKRRTTTTSVHRPSVDAWLPSADLNPAPLLCPVRKNGVITIRRMTSYALYRRLPTSRRHRRDRCLPTPRSRRSFVSDLLAAVRPSPATAGRKHRSATTAARHRPSAKPPRSCTCPRLVLIRFPRLARERCSAPVLSFST